MSPRTIDKAQRRFLSYAKWIQGVGCKCNVEDRIKRARTLLALYFDVRRLKAGLSYRWGRDDDALVHLAFMTVQDAHRALRVVIPRDLMEKMFIESLLAIDNIELINKRISSIEDLDELRESVDKEYRNRHNRKFAPKGGRRKSPLRIEIERIFAKNPSLDLTEVWERLREIGTINGHIYEVDDDVVCITPKDSNDPSVVKTRSEVSKILSEVRNRQKNNKNDWSRYKS